MIEPVHDPAFVNAVAAPAVCGPMPRMDAPTSDWTLDELYHRALWESRQIHARERCCPRYWHFGIVMRLVKAQVRPGRWMEWCLENRIQGDRWKRGRLFAMAFKTAEAEKRRRCAAPPLTHGNGENAGSSGNCVPTECIAE